MQINRIQSNTNFKGLMVFGDKGAVNTKHVETIAPYTTTMGENGVVIKTKTNTLRFELPEKIKMLDVYKAYNNAADHDSNVVNVFKDANKSANYII
ncbi:hypothetical protein IJD34_04160 [bacterium]|nr:hypothetical protein [bacterium]